MEDVLFLLWRGVKGRLVYVEVLGQHGLWGVGDKVRQQQGRVLVKVALVKDEEKLTALVQRLDRVRHAGGHEPEVTLLDVVDRVAPVLVDHREPSGSVQHVRPLTCRPSSVQRRRTLFRMWHLPALCQCISL